MPQLFCIFADRCPDGLFKAVPVIKGAPFPDKGPAPVRYLQPVAREDAEDALVGVVGAKDRAVRGYIGPFIDPFPAAALTGRDDIKGHALDGAPAFVRDGPAACVFEAGDIVLHAGQPVYPEGGFIELPFHLVYSVLVLYAGFDGNKAVLCRKPVLCSRHGEHVPLQLVEAVPLEDAGRPRGKVGVYVSGAFNDLLPL